MLALLAELFFVGMMFKLSDKILRCASYQLPSAGKKVFNYIAYLYLRRHSPGAG